MVAKVIGNMPIVHQSMYLVDLYWQSLKYKKKKTNFACEDGDSDYSHVDATHLEVANLCGCLDGKFNRLWECPKINFIF